MNSDSSGPTMPRTVGYVALAIYLACNLPFIIRYGYRADSSGGVLTAILASVYSGLILSVFFRIRGRFLCGGGGQRKVVIGLVIVTALSFAAMRFVPISTFSIDRWKIINLFWDSVYDGLYPYAMTTPAGNSLGASPVYFLITYPAYLTGWFELLPLSVPWLWWFGFPNLSKSTRLNGLVFLYLSPLFIYEILTRSTLLFNSVLIAAFCFWLLSRKYWGWREVIFYGLLGGLLLNTRTVFGLPLTVTLLFLIRRKGLTCKIFTMGWIMVLFYIGVFLILAICWSPAEVIASNPFTVQSNNLYPPIFMILMTVIALGGGIIARRRDSLFIGGVCMFLAAVAYIILQIYLHGFSAALLGKESDITYLSFCLPFILPYLSQTGIYDYE